MTEPALRGNLLTGFWASDRGLFGLLLVVVLTLFVSPPLVLAGLLHPLVTDVVFSLVLITGVVSLSGRKRWMVLAALLALAAVLARWARLAAPSRATLVVDGVLSLVSTLGLAGLVLFQVLRKGNVNPYRIGGAVVVYLLIGLLWTYAYQLVIAFDPHAVSLAEPMDLGSSWRAGGSLLYFSLVTLATLGYGDVIPFNPVARSLATAEGITGQLYLAILIARLVSLGLTANAARSVITLLTDFGGEDGYVAAMKGVIAGIAPEASVVDVTHRIPPRDVAAGRFRLLATSPSFPSGTVHLAVVDPGVGTARRSVAVRSASGSTFVGPDNGLLGGALLEDKAVAAVELTEPRFWRTPAPSPTFHGRDVFAPVAAHLARGVALEQLGRAIDPAGLVELPLPRWEPTSGGFTGTVQAVDHFGNLITNLPAALVASRGWTLSIAGREAPSRRTYGDVGPGEPVALVGSHGYLEVGIRDGDAQKVLGAGVGHPVRVQLG